jgi:hypothetical protein
MARGLGATAVLTGAGSCAGGLGGRGGTTNGLGEGACARPIPSSNPSNHKNTSTANGRNRINPPPRPRRPVERLPRRRKALRSWFGICEPIRQR